MKLGGTWLNSSNLDLYASQIAGWQDALTADFIFDIPTIIETCSRGITLLPGDVIATGTAAGVGMGMKPPRWLRHGDVVRIEIDGLGVLQNRFTEENV